MPVSSCRKGFFNTAEFMQFMSTPSGFAFNFSDSAPRAVAQYMQTWMAWKSGNLSLLYPEIKIMEKTRFHASPRLRMSTSILPASIMSTPMPTTVARL